MNDLARAFKRLVALGLSSALIALSAGTEAYAAAGRAVEVSGGAHAGPMAMPAGAVQIPSLGASAVLPNAPLNAQSIPGSVSVPGTSAVPNLAPSAAGLATPLAGAQSSASAASAASAAAASPEAAASASSAEAAPATNAVALESAAVSLEKAQPTSVAKTGRIASVVRSIKSVFGAKTAQDLAAAPAAPVAAATSANQAPSAIDPAARLSASPANAPSSAKGSSAAQPQSGDDKGQPPAPPSDNNNGGGGNDDGGASLKAAWRGAIIFITAMLVAQVGIEAWAAASPKWVQTTFGKDGYATMTMVGMGVSLASGFVSGWVSDKLGIKKTAVIATVLYAGAAAAMLLAFKAGVLTFPVLLAIAAARTFLGSASATAEQIIPIAIFKDHKDSLEKFNSTSQFILEVAGIGVPFMIGSLLLTFGSVGTMWILPITMAASAGMLILVGMGEMKKEKKAAAATAKSKEGDATLMKLGMWIYPAVGVLNSLLYSIIALSYGNYVHPGSSPEEMALAAGAAGKVVSLYSAGGLIAAAILSGIPGMAWDWLRKKFPRLNKTHDSFAARFAKADAGLTDEQKEIKRISKWLVLGAVSLVCFVPMLWTSATLASLAMIPFGIANVMSSLQVVSMVQRNVSQDKKGKTMGLLRTLLTLLGGAGMFGFSALFKHFPASPMPFMVLLGVLAALGVYYVIFARKLSAYAASKTGK